MAFKVIDIYEVYFSSRVVEVADDMTEQDAYYKAQDEGVEVKAAEPWFYLDYNDSSITSPEYRDATEAEIKLLKDAG